MKIVALNFFLLLGFITSGCLNSEELDLSKAVSKNTYYSDKMIRVPKSLVKGIEKYYTQVFRGFYPKNTSSDLDLITDVQRRYLQVHIYFVPGEYGRVFSKPVKISFPRGGGIIDLADIIGDRRGDFRFVVRVQEQSGEPFKGKAFFVSNSKSKSLSDNFKGVGCNKFLDITKMYETELNKQGILTTTLEEKHLSLLSGTFVFASAQAKEKFLNLGTVTIQDSRFKTKHCEI